MNNIINYTLGGSIILFGIYIAIMPISSYRIARPKARDLVKTLGLALTVIVMGLFVLFFGI